MTIGSSYERPAHVASEQQGEPANPWSGRFPGPPDLCFDYRKLLEIEDGFATATQPSHRICIVGAGVTGLTAARELLRCGFTDITLIEQSNRIGGRHLTRVSTPSTQAASSPFEMGAMRMPFFNRGGEPPKEGRSAMAYYSKLFDLNISDFPNPGTPQVASTGIYLHEGLLENPEAPTLLIWNNHDGKTPPPSERLQQVYEKWHRFAARVTDTVARHYGTCAWEPLWDAIVARYQGLSFRDLVKLPGGDEIEAEATGDFGGLGMSADESAIFYAIGIGDGSWGAFYDVCCLYPIRTAIFGFSSHLQLVHGRVDDQGQVLPAPFYSSPSVRDSNGVKFQAPRYLGLAALDECLMFLDIDSQGRSLYQHLMELPAGLMTSTKVTGLSKRGDQKIRVQYERRVPLTGDVRVESEDFDSVIVTLPSWIIETQIVMQGFSSAALPYAMVNAYKTAHWETSCKVYAPLKKSFLRDNKNIPQILVTDSFVHDVYTYKYNDRYAYDCILLSYTWEDDASKLAALDDRELVKKCADELDRILLRCANVQQPISPFIDLEGAVVQRWLTDKNALGCAKLYRAGTYYDAVRLMKYNRDCAAISGLYLSGESFSVDAGWTEPAFRGALDAVINLCNNTGASFKAGFTLDDYPQYRLPA